MKAVILVGGEGTRLRPLSLSRPKPMMPLANKPFIEYVLGLLERYGIRDIILSSCYLPDTIKEYLKNGSGFGLRLTYVVEDVPLGTAGAVKNIENLLDSTFLVFNGDILTDLDLHKLIEYHKQKKSKATISLTPVDDPTLYGLVELREDGSIVRFLEKPSWDQVTSDLINAGTYVLEPEVLQLIPPAENYSFERGLFPTLLSREERVFGFVANAYWLDIGTPAKYLLAHRDLLEGKIEGSFEGQEIKSGVWVGEGTEIDPTAKIASPVLIGRGCHIGPNVRIDGLTVIGNNCQIEANAHLESCVIFDKCIVGENSVIINSIIGEGVCLAKRVSVGDEAVVGDGCVIEEENHLRRGIKIWPGTILKKETIKF